MRKVIDEFLAVPLMSICITMYTPTCTWHNAFQDQNLGGAKVPW